MLKDVRKYIEPVARQAGRDRRRRLMTVTVDLIAREGIDAVTHRRVAELAGVPLGSTTYYFASREEMCVQALRHFGEQEAAVLDDRLAPLLGGPRSALRYTRVLVDLVAPQTGADRLRTVAQFALLVEAARTPELSEVVRAWNDAWLRSLTEAFRALGAAAPHREARTLLALIDGLLISQLAAPEADFINAILKPCIQDAFQRAAGARGERA